MYIWFITHYLAMCHTITNPLIYIWMNNRFRAGFKQVIGDLYRPLKQVTTYLCCYCLCLACLFDCSKKRYSRVALSDRKRYLAQSSGRQLTSSTSANSNNVNRHRALGQHKYSANDNEFNQKVANRTVSSGPILAGSTNMAEGQNLIAGPFRQQEGSSLVKFAESSLSVDEQAAVGSPEIAHPAGGDNLSNGLSNPARHRKSGFASSASRVVGRAAQSIKQIKKFRVRHSNQPSQPKNEDLGRLPSKSTAEPINAKRKRQKRKESLGINIQMTTVEFRPNTTKTADNQANRATNDAANASATCDDAERKNCKPKTRWIGGGSGKVKKPLCPTCRSGGDGSVKTKNPKHRRLDKLERDGDFVIDMRRASQSTATSLQTNLTSLAVSSINSARSGGGGGGSSNNNNSTSVSLSSGAGRVSFAQKSNLSEQGRGGALIGEQQEEIVRSAIRGVLNVKHRRSSTASSRRCSARSIDELPYLDETNSGSSQLPDGATQDQATANSGSLMSSDQANAATNGASSLEESSNSRTAEELLKERYCHKHRYSHQRYSISVALDSANQEDNHETDDDVFDVFLEKRDNLQTKSIGSLEFIRDRRDEEENSDLIAEYDDLSPVRHSRKLECFELAPLHKAERIQGANPGSILQGSPARRENGGFLSRKFRPTSDELFRNQLVPEASTSAAPSTVRNNHLPCRDTNGVKTNQQVNLQQQQQQQCSDTIMIASGKSDGVAPIDHLCSPRDRSLRHAMLLNNHLMLSSNVAKIHTGSIKDLTPSSGNKLEPLGASKTIDVYWRSSPVSHQKRLVYSSQGEICNSLPCDSQNHSSVALTNQSSSAPASMTNATKPALVAKGFCDGGHHEPSSCYKPIPSNGTSADKAQVRAASSNGRAECLASSENGHKSALYLVLEPKKNQRDEGLIILGNDERFMDKGKNGIVVRKSPTIYAINKPNQLAASSDSIEALV